MPKQKRFLAIASLVLASLALIAWNTAGWAQSLAGALQPLLQIADSELSSPPVIIAYGDMRFTDPTNVKDTNPKVRQWLIDRIAWEKPNALLLSGDVPMRGGVANDYAVFKSETAPWKAAGIYVIPAIGNHELYNDKPRLCVYDQPCLDNWWNTFPQLRGVRWYSVQIGSRMLVVNLDSDLSLDPGSDQIKWLQRQINGLAPAVHFVFINMHHPPVTDAPEKGVAAADAPCSETVSPRCNEIALAEFLRTSSATKRVRFIVLAAHVHNYQRFLRDGIVYLVSGGGGAPPDPVKRGPDDLYKNSSFPNYHYMKFVLREDGLDAEMIRLSDPLADAPGWEVKDRFQVK